MSNTSHRKPGIRIDGGKRRDLNPQRVAARMVGLPQSAPTLEDSEQRFRQMAKRRKQEKAAARSGGEGTVITSINLRISSGRTSLQAVRCRPGTFAWRYGRDKQSALFHAGSHLAQIWERAGMTIASSANFLRGTTSGYGTGLAEGRVIAIDLLRGFVEEMGRVPSERLIDYCVIGLTTAEVAKKHGATERAMAPVLDQDLRTCAEFFKFIGGNRR